MNRKPALFTLPDVNATIPAFGVGQDVFDCTTKLCREIDPTGHIVVSRCDIHAEPVGFRVQRVQ